MLSESESDNASVDASLRSDTDVIPNIITIAMHNNGK